MTTVTFAELAMKWPELERVTKYYSVLTLLQLHFLSINRIIEWIRENKR